ncbi:hypothetical protein M409DRAFT_52604 [Zasmidium cellare ATCC 36951]|uniref:Extracellular membrane protein CFEM domain-containing protein n=1 Tax=Zasmidium cellare ATCC 36951 TaxID=1080233 RepID=A0A6A6CRN1_ZASCE|nr:uncharacterized protein M409DRAFT_52604 [Zasmidium cellare ATCC 36951]KAF2169353.1 hypothetical protein M409DRAFT_52604 [Zasmidium cellare ATCC 36951]
MFSIFAILIALFSSPKASASGLPQLPARTLHAKDAFDIAGWTPKPTSAPKLDLFRRQDSDLSPLCGFVNGNVSQILSCTAQTEYCNFDVPSSAFGCCTGSELTGCGYFTSCLDSTAPCDAACQRNTAIQRCSESLFPSCVKYTYDIAGAIFSNFGCQDVASTPTPVVEVLATTVDETEAEETGAAVETSSAAGSDSVSSEESAALSSSPTLSSSSLDRSSSEPTIAASSSSNGRPSLTSSTPASSRVAFTQTQASAGGNQAESTSSPAASSSAPASEGSASKSMEHRRISVLGLCLGIFALCLAV